MNRSMTLPARTLADETAWMAKLRPGSGFNPSTKTVQITALLGALQLRRTDFEQYRETVIPAEGAGQFDAIVDAAKLAELLKPMNGSVAIDFNGKLTVAVNGTAAALRSSEASEFPGWPVFTPVDEPAIISAAQAARVLTSVGTDATLPVLTVVAFDKGAMVTTDRFRLTRITYDEDSTFTTLVPGDVLRAFASGNDILTVQPGVGEKKEPLVQLTSGGRSIVAPVPDVEFPKWRQLVPEQTPVGAMVRRDDLAAAVARGERTTLTLRDDDTMLVCVDGGEDSDFEISTEVKTEMASGDLPFTVTMLSKYVTEAMRAMGSGAVLIGATTPVKPVVFRDASGAVMHLIMPIRTGQK